MRRRVLVGPIMAALLTACAATQPRAATTPTAVVAMGSEPTATATPPGSTTNTPIVSPPASAAPDATATLSDENGAVTPSMAQVGIGGARYATLGDPNAPLTIVEYSDFG